MSDKAIHSIAAASQRTGLPQDLLRAWERRYQAVCPERSQGGRRLYTSGDLDRLLLLKQAIAKGHRIGALASLQNQELEELVRQSDRSLPQFAQGTTGGSEFDAEHHLKEMIQAVQSAQANALSDLLDAGSVGLSLPRLLDSLILPLIEWIGVNWHEGELRVSQEHMATAVLRTFLGNLLARRRAAPGAPCIVAATPSGQRHELGALLVGLTAQEAGWEVCYLGPDLPAEEIAAMVHACSAQAVALSISAQTGSPQLPGELNRLLQLLPPHVKLYLGGRAAPDWQQAGQGSAASQVQFVSKLNEFSAQLVQSS